MIGERAPDWTSARSDDDSAFIDALNSATTMSDMDGSPYEPINDPSWTLAIRPMTAKFGTRPSRGTAFHVGKGWFLTAAHNFINWDSGVREVADSAQVMRPDGQQHAIGNDDWIWWSEYYHHQDKSYDVVLFKGYTAARQASLLTGAKRGDGWVLGYQWAANVPQLWSAPGPYERSNDGFFLDHNASTRKGESGGPLITRVNKSTRTIGIHIRSEGDDNRAVALWPELVAFIDQKIAA